MQTKKTPPGFGGAEWTFRCSQLRAEPELRAASTANSPNCAHSPPCLEQKLTTFIVRGTGNMTYYFDAATAELEHEFERMRFKQRHRAERRSSSNLGMTPAIKMLIGDWY